MYEDPVAEEDEGRDFDELEKEKNGYQCHDPGTGIKKEISSHDTGDRSARPDGRDIGTPIRKKVDQTGCHATEKIEDKISNMSEPVFDVISKDIEKPHIHNNMKEASMKKHGSQKRKSLLERCEVRRESRIGVSEGDNPIEIKGFFQGRALSELP